MSSFSVSRESIFSFIAIYSALSIIPSLKAPFIVDSKLVILLDTSIISLFNSSFKLLAISVAFTLAILFNA